MIEKILIGVLVILMILILAGILVETGLEEYLSVDAEPVIGEDYTGDFSEEWTKCKVLGMPTILCVIDGE